MQEHILVPMSDDRKSGVALVAGSIGGLLTMAMHPVGAGVMTRPQLEHLAVVSAIAHTLGMVSTLALLLGGMGLTRRLSLREQPEAPDRIALVALTVFAFAAVALMLATAVSGFIVPGIMRHMLRDTAGNAPQWQIVIEAVFQFNQAFARIYSVAASGAILLWSASVLRNGGPGRGTSIFGCIVGAILIGVIAVGHLRLDVHGMAVVVLGHAVWFVLTGVRMYRQGGRRVAVAG